MLLAGRDSQAKLQALSDSSHSAFLNNLLAFQGNPREQIYENQVPDKSLHMQLNSAAGKRWAITLNRLISPDPFPKCN